MSIASEITRLQQAKSDLATSIAANGVTVPAATTLDGYAALVDQIQQGGGTLPYDAEVEYIEGGVFETEFVPAGNAVHTWKYRCLNKVNYNYVFSCIPIESGKWYIFAGWQNAGNGTQILYGSSSKYGGKDLALNTDYTGIADFSGGTKTLKWNGTTIISLSATNISNTYSFRFQLTAASSICWRLYWFNSTVGGKVVANFVPVRIGQVGYLYDKISGKLYTNSDTSVTPVLGPDVT